MKWAVDKIINDIATLENIETLEKKEISTSLLPTSIHEGAILKYEDNKYTSEYINSLNINNQQKAS